MNDSVNNISLPRLNIPSLFDDGPVLKNVTQKVEQASDQFRFTTESSLEGLYKNPKQNVNQRDATFGKAETKSENWFG